MNEIISATEILERAARVGLKPASLARKAGLGQSTISRWANGRTDIGLKNYVSILAALGSAEVAAAEWHTASARELRQRIARSARSNDPAMRSAASAARRI
jgi:transcriptional regulator with XRE-family HTH domain